MLDILIGKLVAICYLDTFLSGVNEQGAVVLLCLLQDHNAGGDVLTDVSVKEHPKDV